MRTTLTLDDDVAALLKKEAGKSGLSFKAAVNRYLRLGLRQSKASTPANFVIEPFSLRVPPDLRIDCIGELLEQLEGPEHL